MKDGEGVAEMYSGLALITNEIAALGSEEMTDKFIIKMTLRALDGKYDTMCTLIQMMPNYKDLKPTEVIGRIVAHEMSLEEKKSFTTSLVVLTKLHVMLLHHQVINKYSMKN